MRIRLNRFLLLALSTAGVAVFTSCAVVEIHDQTVIVESTARFRGTVDVVIETDAKVYAALLKVEAGTAHWINEYRVGRSGRFDFYASPGDYAIAAFADENSDKVYQYEEPASYAGFDAGEPVIYTVSGGEKITVPTLVVSGPLDNVSQYVIVPNLSKATQNIGARTSLDDDIFSDDFASMGMWRPLDFLGQVGGGLFMLDKYSPDKTPLIFVHGILGDPRNFREAIAAVDKTRFQPWVYYYPSGIRLDMASDFLVKAVNQLQAQYRFTRYFLVAHSMGGLTALSFVKKYYASGGVAQLAFVMTINSPIGGLASARQGVDHSPVVVPAWRDLATGSKFIKDLEQWQWPEETAYHLVFSYQTGEDGDGLVALGSQIPSYLQKQAVRMYGYDAGHADILKEPVFLKDLNAILLKSLDRLPE